MDDIFHMPDDWKIAGHDEAVNPSTEDKGLIITGLGGKGKQFRYIIAISAKSGGKLKPSFKKIVSDKFSELFSPNKAVLEKISVRPDYIKIQALIHMDYSVESIVMGLIKAINKDINNLMKYYLVSNSPVADSEIWEHMAKARKPSVRMKP